VVGIRAGPPSTVLGHKFKSLTKTTFTCHHLFINQKSTTYVIVGIRRLRGGFQSYSDLASELAVSRDAA